jgi:hypothetical protein
MKKILTKFPMYPHLMKDFFLSFDFFLLIPCTNELSDWYKWNLLEHLKKKTPIFHKTALYLPTSKIS